MDDETANKTQGAKSSGSLRAANLGFRLPMDRDHVLEVLRFGIIGLSSVGFYYALLIGFVELFNIPVLISAVLAYIISMIWNYWRQRSWTFKSDRDHRSAVPGYLVTHLIGMAINTLVLYLLIDFLVMHYILAQVFATCAVAAWSYLSLKIWVFRRA